MFLFLVMHVNCMQDSLKLFVAYSANFPSHRATSIVAIFFVTDDNGIHVIPNYGQMEKPMHGVQQMNLLQQ